jgi:hypothetical protein
MSEHDMAMFHLGDMAMPCSSPHDTVMLSQEDSTQLFLRYYLRRKETLIEADAIVTETFLM